MRAQDPPCPWDEQACNFAAHSGNLEMLQWLRAQDPPCPWDARTCTAATREGHLEMLQWMRAQDPPLLMGYKCNFIVEYGIGGRAVAGNTGLVIISSGDDWPCKASSQRLE
jgi:hypothetical protein